MQGRLEHQLEVEKRINNKLQNLPSYVSEFYYNLSYGSQFKTCDVFINIIKQYLDSINTEYDTITFDDLSKNITRFLHSKSIKIVNGEQRSTSMSYQHSIYTALNSFFKFLEFQGYIDKNPINMVDTPKGQDRIERKFINSKDMKKILECCKKGYGSKRAKSYQKQWEDRDILILLLFMNTGMRKTALTEINIEDIDMIEWTLIIRDKGNITHKYDIESLKVYIENWLEQREKCLEGVSVKEDALFISSQKKRISSSAIENIVSKYSIGALGYDLSPHKLRASFCTNLYEETGDIEFVRRAVGHSNVNTTQRYIISDEAEIKKKTSNIMAKKLGIN